MEGTVSSALAFALLQNNAALVSSNLALVNVLRRQQRRVKALGKEVTELHAQMHLLCDIIESKTATLASARATELAAADVARE